MLHMYMTRLQRAMSCSPSAGYVVIVTALSLSAFYLMGEGYPALVLIIKVLMVGLTLSLWVFMVYTFMQTPFPLLKCIFAATITFLAQTNVIAALSMGPGGVTFSIWVFIFGGITSLLVVALMAEIRHLRDIHHGK